MGALLPHRDGAEGDLDPRVLAHSGSVVLVSQGTVDNHDPRKLIVPAIEAFAGTERLVVVATGGLGSANLRQRYPHENVIVSDFVDFDGVLPHTELFITNGGLGGVLLALSHGVPLLVAGKKEGKGDINARLAYRGLTVDLRTERPSARAITRGARQVLGDAGMHARLAAVRNRLAAYDLVEIVVHTLLADLTSEAREV